MIYSLTISNWAKYNPRSDRANYSWFRFENGFFNDQDIFGLTESEQLTFIFLCCEASKRNDPALELRLDYIALQRKKTPEEILNHLQVLSSCRLIAVNPPANCRQEAGKQPALLPATRRDERNETNETNVKAPGSGNPGALVKNSVLPEGVSPTAITWRAYKNAFEARYGTAPPWNAKTAGQLRQFVSRIPQHEAPQVAQYYLRHNGYKYVNNMHPVGLMLQDAEKLRTEWATNRQVTTADAKNADRRQGNLNVWAEIKTEMAK